MQYTWVDGRGGVGWGDGGQKAMLYPYLYAETNFETMIVQQCSSKNCYQHKQSFCVGKVARALRLGANKVKRHSKEM